MVKRLLLAILLIGSLTATAHAAVEFEAVLVLKKAKDLHKLQKKHKFEVIPPSSPEIEALLASIDSPVFNVRIEARNQKKLDKAIKKLRKEKKVVAITSNWGLSVSHRQNNGNASVNQLDQSVMWLFNDRPMTSFFGTDVAEEYANQGAIDLVGARDVWPLADGSGTRIAFIDTGADREHPALRPWMDGGVDLLGTGSTSEAAGMDQSVMWLFEEMSRLLRQPKVDQSVMWLFVAQLERLGLEQSVMWLFGEQLDYMALEQSVMWLFDELLKQLGTNHSGDLDQSVMWLFNDHLQKLANGDTDPSELEQSVMWLFNNRLREITGQPVNGDLEQSVMWLFNDRLKTLDSDGDGMLDQSVMWLFNDRLEMLAGGGLDQSVMWLFGDGVDTLDPDLDQSVMWLFSDTVSELDLEQSVMWLFGESSSPDDPSGSKFGHGTVVAGLLHAIAPEATLIPIRAFDSAGNSSLYLVTTAIYAAVAQGADVINMSFSIGENSDAFEAAVRYASSEGVVLVASAGNDAIDAGEIYPAAYPQVISVGATDLDDHLADFSNFGRSLSVVAPGEEVVSTYPGGLYARASGTSFSAPIVAGAIAILLSQGDEDRQAIRHLFRSADDIDDENPDYDRLLGDGRIDLADALR